MKEKKINKVGIFIDGTFFLKINSYYRYHHERKSTLNFKGLFDFILYKIAEFEGIEKRYVRICESHWFRGRYSTNQLEKKYTDADYRLTQMNNERRIDDIFMYEGLIPHNYPLLVDSKTSDAEEKGIDIWLSLETFDIARRSNLETAVVIAGDSSYVPLIKKLISIDCKVVVLGWDFSYDIKINTGQKYSVTTRTSQSLLEECIYPIMMDDIINDNKASDADYINNLFNV